MTNLLLYAEARDRLDQLTAQPSPCDEHPLSYPDDLYEELNRGEASAPADNTSGRICDILDTARMFRACAAAETNRPSFMSSNNWSSMISWIKSGVTFDMSVVYSIRVSTFHETTKNPATRSAPKPDESVRTAQARRISGPD